MPTIREVLTRTAPRADKRFLAALGPGADAVLRKWDMHEAAVAARFLAQCHHETTGWREFEENMRYSAKRLTQVWPSRFPTLASAQPFAGNPKALAIKVYGGRMGNAPAPSDDGWIYRGGGATHHTGKAEYARVLRRTGHAAEAVRDPGNPVAMLDAACSYWADRNVIAVARMGRDRDVTLRINGGLIGHEDRLVLTKRYLAAFNGQPIPAARTRLETAQRQEKQASASAVAAVSTAAPAAAPQVQEAGFAPVIGLVLAALIIGGAGWLLWRRAAKARATLLAESISTANIREMTHAR